MELKFRKIEVTQEFADEVQKWLDIDEPKPLEPGESDVVTMTAQFNDGVEVDVKVCYGQSNTYLDVVLFKDGSEVCVADPSEEFLGELYFEYDGVEYLVDVVVKSDDGVNLLYASHKDRNRTVEAVEENYDVISCDEFEHDGKVFVGIFYKDTDPGVKRQAILVPREEANLIQKYLDADNGTMVHDIAPTVDIFEADFGNGITAEIRVCYEHDTNFIDPILYHNDEEVQVLDCSYQFLNRFEFDYEDIEYVVDVKLTPERMKKTIFIAKKEAAELQKYLDADKYALKRPDGQIVHVFTAHFSNGMEADIRVCIDREEAIINPIFFEDDGKSHYLDEDFYELLGEYEFTHDSITYVVVVDTLPTSDVYKSIEVDRATLDKIRNFLSGKAKDPTEPSYWECGIQQDFGYGIMFNLDLVPVEDVMKIIPSLSTDRGVLLIEYPALDYLPTEFKIEFDDIQWTLAIEEE